MQNISALPSEVNKTSTEKNKNPQISTNPHDYPHGLRWLVSNKPIVANKPQVGFNEQAQKFFKEKKEQQGDAKGLTGLVPVTLPENGPQRARRRVGLGPFVATGHRPDGTFLDARGEIIKVPTEYKYRDYRGRASDSPECEGRERANGRPLANGHISPRQNFRVQYHTHANLIKITKKPKPGLERERIKHEDEEIKNTGTRGKIIEFTRKSRRNLMNLTARIMKITLPIFITLTFPDDHPGIKPSKRYLDNFIKRVRRKYPNAGYLWRMEIKPRKSGKHKGELAVHYHMFIWGVAMDDAIWELPRMWTQVCKCHDVWHYFHGCDVGPIEKEKGVWSYVSKYIGKLDTAENEDLEKGIGRVWGYGGKIPLDPGENCDITAQEACILLRYLRRATSLDNKGIRTFYVNRPYQWYMRHLDLIRYQTPF